MELQTFIRQALVQIGKGAAEAGEELQDVGVRVSPQPSPETPLPDGYFHTVNRGPCTSVDIDLSVVVEEGKEKGAKINVVAAVLGTGGEIRRVDATSSTHRLRVRVPIELKRTVFRDRTSSGSSAAGPLA